MEYTKKQLLAVAQKVETAAPLTPKEIQYLLTFKKTTDGKEFFAFLKRIAFPASLTVSALFAIFPDVIDPLVKQLPSWTNLSPRLLAGINYLWDFFGEPIKKSNIIYHLPNVILYTFGISGIKFLIDSVEHKTWLEKVLLAQATLRTNVDKGILNLQMKKGHSLLFVGKGDYIGTQFTLNHKADETVTISQIKPTYTEIWNAYDITTLYDNLKEILIRSDGESAGEYVFFPVKDEELFLPNEQAYDLSPHKIDIICQNIRKIEKDLKWQPKRIIIIGDKSHQNFVKSVDQNTSIPDSEDSISLQSISEKYENVTLLDPSDIVIKKILEIARGRKIFFRATEDGINEYKTRFYQRLKSMGYNDNTNAEGSLTIGYDIFEDQTEQQTLAKKVDDYYPVVLSKNVSDALIRNGLHKHEFLYVPSLVLEVLALAAREQ